MEKIHNFLLCYQNKKFKKREGNKYFNSIDLMKQHEGFNETKKFLEEKYKEGFGFKSLIKEFDLPVTYSKIRYLFDLMKIDRRKGYNVVTDRLKKVRSDKALLEFKNKTGWFKPEVQKKLKIKNSVARGINGFYFNKSMQKYVWLRSSWEYIYAKWLDSKEIKWGVETIHFELKNGKQYRPDFFIYDNNVIKKIVEIKGYWKDKLWKYYEIEEELNNDYEFILITNIRPFVMENEKLEDVINWWRKNRILKIEE